MHTEPLHLAFFVARDWTHPNRAGGDLYMGALAREAAAQGHRVSYLCGRYTGADARERVDGVDIIRLGGPLPQTLRAMRHYLLHLRGRVDVIAAEVIGGMYLPYFAPLWTKEPLIAFWYQYTAPLAKAQFGFPLAQVAGIIETLVKRTHQGVQKVTLAPDRARDLIAFGVHPHELSIIPGALSAEQFALVPPQPVKVDPPLFVYIGKLRRYKCPDHLLRAGVELKRQGLSFRLVLAGYPDGRGYEQELRQLVTDLNLTDRAEIQTDLSEEAKFALASSATAVVVPSPVEGFSLAAVEGGASRAAVVASDGVPATVVTEGLNGLRYPYGDTLALAGRMRQLIEDPALAAALGQRGQEMAHRYSWTRNVQQMLALLQPARARVLSPWPSPPAQPTSLSPLRASPRMPRDNSVSVIFPTYNERDSIQAAIVDFASAEAVHEIVVINNNAAPGTSQEVEMARSRVRAGVVVREIVEPRQGYGHAIRRGIQEAAGELLIIAEPDGTFLGADVAKLLAYEDEYDIVFGTRTSRHSIWTGANMGPLLRWGNWGVAKMVEVLYGSTYLSDVGCTMRLLHRRALFDLRESDYNGSNTYGLEMLLDSLSSGLRVIQIPLNYLPRVGESSVTGDMRKAVWLGMAMGRLVLGEWLASRRHRRPKAPRRLPLSTQRCVPEHVLPAELGSDAQQRLVA